MAEADRPRWQRGHDVGAVNQPIRKFAERLVILCRECPSAHSRHAVCVNRICLNTELSECALSGKHSERPAQAMADEDKVLRFLIRPGGLPELLHNGSPALPN